MRADPSIPKPSQRQKPRVGIVYSHSIVETAASRDLAVYLGACLQLGGYSNVYLLAFRRDGAPLSGEEANPLPNMISVIPQGGVLPQRPDPSECGFKPWTALGECNMVVICVDPTDTNACAKEVARSIKKGEDLAYFSLQRGVRNFATMKTHLDGHGVVVLDGAVGLMVTRHPVDGALTSFAQGSLVVQRLSKAQTARGLKFVNLLRTSGIQIRHCRNITPFTHGSLLFQTLDAAAALTGLSLGEHLMNPWNRLVWAAMIREGLETLAAASRGGGWQPANPCSPVTLPQLELFLCLPTPIFKMLR
ncbi:unnamed protein product [Discosporangium mesarthrocarpum]